MARSVILQNPLFEDTKLFSLESLLGRCVSNVCQPTDNFEPDLDVSLNDWLKKYTLEPNKISFKKYIKANSDASLEAKITDIFTVAQTKHHSSEVDIEEAEATSLSLIQLEKVFTTLRSQSQWLNSVTELWRRNGGKAYWIVGITVVTGGKINSTQRSREEYNVESTLPLGKAAAAAAASQGVAPNFVPLESLDVQAKVAKMTETDTSGELEVTGRCLFSIRYALLARANCFSRKMVYVDKVRFLPQTGPGTGDPKETREIARAVIERGKTRGWSRTKQDERAKRDKSTEENKRTEENKTTEENKSADENKSAEEKKSTEENETESPRAMAGKELGSSESDERFDIRLDIRGEVLDEDLRKAGCIVISHVDSPRRGGHTEEHTPQLESNWGA